MVKRVSISTTILATHLLDETERDTRYSCKIIILIWKTLSATKRKSKHIPKLRIYGDSVQKYDKLNLKDLAAK